jgi:adenylate kinase
VEVLVERLTARQTCASCGATFNRATHPARVDGQCDSCGGRLTTRPDDQPETVRRRLQAYQAATVPVLGFLAARGWPVRSVPSVGEVTEVYGRILAAGCPQVTDN